MHSNLKNQIIKMKSFGLAVALLITLSTTSEANIKDPKYYQITKSFVRELNETQAQKLAPRLTPNCEESKKRKVIRSWGRGFSSGLDEIEIIVDQIINIGQKIWNLVQAGRPVVNVEFPYASALPRGAGCWLDLNNWQEPQSKVYEAIYENALGMQVVSFKYRTLFVAGGSVDGIGQYVGYASMMPVVLDVAWGYKFDATASAPIVVNLGSKRDPLAGLQMLMNYKIETIMTNIQESQTYFINGKGEFKTLE